MSFADEYMAFRKKRLAEIKETGKMKGTPVESTAPTGAGTLSDFGTNYMALRQKRIADGYKALTTPPDLSVQGLRPFYDVTKDPYAEARKNAYKEMRESVRPSYEIRTEIDRLPDDSFVGPTKKGLLENELAVALQLEYEPDYASGNYDLSGIYNEMNTVSAQIAELDKMIQEDETTLANFENIKPEINVTPEMLAREKEMRDRMETNKETRRNQQNSLNILRNQYDYFLGRIYFDEKNDRNAEDIIAEGKKIHEDALKGYESYLNNKKDYKLTLALTPEEELSRALAPFRAEARSHYPLAVMIEGLPEEDQKTFYYLVGKGQDDLALQFANESSYADRIEQNAKTRQWAGKNLGTGLLGTAGSVLTLPYAWSDALLNEGAKSATGLAYAGGGFGALRDNLRGGVTESLNDWSGTVSDKVPVLGGKGLGDLYALGMSIADSHMAGGLTGGGDYASVLLGGSAFSSGYNNAIDKGASVETAMLQGAAQGLAEMVFEYASLDMLFNGKITGSFFKKMFAQGGIEASEEVCTSVANFFTDRWIMGGLSDYETSVQEYMKKGMTEEEARNKAKWDFVENTAADAFGGLLSGGGSAGMHTGISNSNISKAYGPYADSLVAKALEIDPNNAFAQQMQKQIESGNQLSGNQLRQIVEIVGYDVVEAIVEDSNIDDTKPDWEQYEQGHSGDRFQYDPSSEPVDQLEDMRGWREDTYAEAQTYTDQELALAIQEQKVIRDDNSQDNKSRAIAQHHLDALEYTQMQRQNNNAALNEQRVEGVNYSGTEGINDSGQRDEGVGTRGSVGGLETGTGRSVPRGQGKTEKAIVEDIRGNAAAQSAREIGIIGGSESADLRVIPADRIGESESWSRIRDEVEAKGQKLVLVVGKMETVDPVTKKVYTHEGIRQVNADGTVTYYIKADKISRNAEQIYKHEDFHDIVHYNPELLPGLVKALEDQYGKQELMSLIYSYVEAFDGVYGTFKEGMAEKAERDLIMKYAEEIFADAYGEINRGRKNIENAKQVLRDQTDRVQRAAQNRRATETKTAPPIQSFSIANTSKLSLKEQLSRYYKNEMLSSDSFYFGNTPAELEASGLPPDPLVWTISDFKKSTKEKHNVPRRSIKDLHKNLSEAILSFGKDGRVGVVTKDIDADGKPLIVGIHSGVRMDNRSVNAIKSAYGLDNPAEWINNQLAAGKELVLYDKKRADAFLRSYGYEASQEDGVYSLRQIITHDKDKVKQNFSIDDEARELDDAYARQMEEDDSPEGMPSEQEIRERYDQLARDKKERNAKEAPLHTLKSRIDSAEKRIATLRETKKTLKGIGGLTAEVSKSLDSQIEKARETLKIDKAEWQKKWREHAAEEKKKAKEKKEKEIATQKARTAQKELKQDLLNLFSVREGTRTALGDLIDKLSDKMLAQGHLSHEDRKNLFDALMDHGEKLSNPDEYFQNVRNFMTRGRIYVNEDVRAEFGDDWKAFRNRAWGNRIYLTSDKTDVEIDVWTECLKTEFGGQFSGENDLKTQLEMIVELAEEGKPERLTIAEMMQREMDEFGWSVEEQVEELERKVDKLLEIFAQKADLEIRLRQQSLRQRMKDYELYRTMQEKKRQSAMENQARKNVMSAVQKLNRMRKRASPDQREAIDEALKGIDVVARSISASGLEDLQELARLYNEQREAQGANFLSSPYVEARLARLGQKQIDDMDIEDVVELGRMVCSITNSIQNSNKLLASARNEDIYATARKAEEEIWNSEGSKDGLIRKLTLNHLDGKRFFGQISGWVNGVVERLGEALSTGQERQMRYQMNAMRIFDSFLSKEENQKFMKSASGKDAEWIKVSVPNGFKIQNHGILVETSEIEITPMMRISLLLHSKNEDNLRHIMNGGIRVPNKEQYRKGNMKAAYDRGLLVKMDPATVRAIVKGCTEQEKAFARLCESYFNGMAKDSINEVSMVLDGFERAGGEHYYHIKTDPAFLAKQNDSVKRDLSVAATASIVNERVHASNPIVLQDVTDALLEHIESISKYYGYAVPIRDLNAVLGQSFHGEENAFNGSVLETLKQKWGGSAEAYIDKLMADLQLPDSSKDYLSDFMVKLRGNYAKAVISANLSSLLKQTTSYPVALPYLKMDGLIHGLAFKGMAQDVKTLEKYSAVYWYRNQGNSTAELSDVLKRREFGDTLPWLFNATQKMDSWTTRRILAACEYRVQKDMGLIPGTQAEIDAGTDRYWSEVAKLFNDVVLKTQSNSTMMERPQITRANAGNISRFLTMFRTDAYQQYNMLVEAAGRLRAAKKNFENEGNAKNKKVLSEARHFATRTVVGTLIGQIGCALVGVLLKKLRYDDEEFVGEDGQWNWGKVAGYIGGSVIEGYCGFITCGEWLYAAVEASLDKSKKWWDIDVSGLSVIDDVATAGINLVQALTAANFWEGKGAAKDFALALSKVAGIPAENMEKYLYMCLRWVAPEFVAKRENFWDEITKNDLSKESRKTIHEAVSVLMDNRTEGLSDHEKDEIARLYMAGGVGAVPAGIPASISYTNEDGEQISVELTAGQQKQFRELWSGIISEEIGKIVETDAYKEADDEGKTELLAKLYSYANAMVAHELVPEKEVDKWVLQGETAQENGIPLGEYIAFRVGLSDVTGKDDLGETVTGLKAQRSMELIEAMGWSDHQEQSVWLDVVASDSVGAATKALTDAGVPWDIVNNIVVMQGGKTEKLVAIGEAKLSDQVKVKAMSVYANDLGKKMLSVGLKYGVKPEWYAEVLKNANTDGKGGVSQSEAQEYILGMGLSLQEMAVLFQMITDAKEGKSNPFYPSYAEMFWYDVHEADPE